MNGQEQDKCDYVWKEQADIIKLSPGHYLSYNWHKKIFKDAKGVILDIGCGICTKADYFLNKDLKYIGTDHSSVAVDISKQRGYEAYVMSATELKFDRQFDYILSMDMLEHIKDDEKVLQNAYKYFKEGGQLVLSTAINMKYWNFNDEHSGHFRRYEPEALFEMLKRNGFKIDKVYYLGFPLCNLYKEIQFFLGRSKDKSENKKYVPTGIKRKIAKLVLPLILPLFKLDNLFSSEKFKGLARGIIVIASK